VASLVNHETAYLTLVALLAESPNEIFAVRTKGGLLEEARYELVILYNEDVLLF